MSEGTQHRARQAGLDESSRGRLGAAYAQRAPWRQAASYTGVDRDVFTLWLERRKRRLLARSGVARLAVRVLARIKRFVR